MSASLVGSEMCIRDRHLGQHSQSRRSKNRTLKPILLRRPRLQRLPRITQAPRAPGPEPRGSLGFLGFPGLRARMRRALVEPR
eukprot:7556310-Alexandrium_andersonii.AAC.1